MILPICEVIKLLRQHNEWRRFDRDEPSPEMLSPKLLGQAIDSAVFHLENRSLKKEIDTLIADWRACDGSDKYWLDIRDEFADKLEAAANRAERTLSPEDQAVNAKLSAAPDLYNALSVLADACESMGIPVDAARATLAKASP